MLIWWHYDFTPVLKVLLGASFFFSLLKDSQINATVAIEMEQTKKSKPEIHCDFLALVHTRQNTYYSKYLLVKKFFGVRGSRAALACFCFISASKGKYSISNLLYYVKEEQCTKI